MWTFLSYIYAVFKNDLLLIPTGEINPGNAETQITSISIYKISLLGARVTVYASKNGVYKTPDIHNMYHTMNTRR